MIDFKCHCGESLSVPTDQAGGMIQCPRCGRLNDVPTLSDLKNLDEHGNYKVDDVEIPLEPDRIREATRAFTRRHVDDFGNEIDLRLTLEEIAAAGADEIPLVDEEQIPPTPKYDPLTGELVEPLKIKPDPAIVSTADLPVANVSLPYATAQTAPASGPVLLALLQPGNLFVMGVILFFIILCGAFQIMLNPLSMVTGVPAYYLNFFWLLLPPHHVIVLEEIARADKDELPRPWRDLSFIDDVWNPLGNFCFALMVGYLPAWVYAKFYAEKLNLSPVADDVVMSALLLFGATAFPVLLMTIVTSGAANNLRPDRLVRTVIACGWRYWLVALVWTATLISGLWLIGGVALVPLDFLAGWLATPAARQYASVPILFVHIYLAHWCAWTLGLLYRSRHESFGWVLQKHVYRNRTHHGLMRPSRRRSAPANRPAPRSPVR